MGDYTATVAWQRDGQTFTDNAYSRGHQWRFDGGTVIEASSSPHIVPLPHSVAANVDPEEAFVASLSSCHMLFFLAIAAKRRFVIDSYEDEAIGIMARDVDGNQAMTLVTLRPKAIFSGDRQPTDEQIEMMHHQAHRQCFIANSVKTEVRTEPRR
ncbi:MAG: OsmC family protein [Acidobacteriota bacterium]